MKKFSQNSIAWAAIMSCLFSLTVTTNAQYNVLHHFTGPPNDGGWMALSVFIESDSVLYGMTAEGGGSNNGTIFKINKDGTNFRILYSFISPDNDGTRPYGSLVLEGSTLFGMAGSVKSDYNGTFFRIDTNGTNYQVLHTFSGSEGKWPYDTPIMSGSVFYGLTTYGGSDTTSGWKGGGTIFRMNTDGSGFRLLHTFYGGNDDGLGPHGSLIQIGSVLYGTALVGGYGAGTIFKIDTNGTGFQLLHRFTAGSNDGSLPFGTTLVLSDSTFYGMTREGGSSGEGVVFKMKTDGSGFGLLHSFSGGANDGRLPEGGSLVLSDSTLFGMTTSGGTLDSGTIFTIKTDGSEFRLLHSFNGSDGKGPLGSLFLSDSVLYGMASEGGINNLGVIFALDLRQITGINEKKSADKSESFKLYPNYPNPFIESTTIEYSIADANFVRLAIYDVSGREIITLVEENKSAGEYTVNFEASDLSPGVYFYKIEVGDFSSQPKKMILVD